MRLTRTKTGFAVMVSILVIACVSVALATDSASSNPSPGTASLDTSYGIGDKSWAVIGAKEFASLPVGTRIIDCSPEHKSMPTDLRMESGPGGPPGQYLLSDGRCAFDPNAIAIPMRQDNVDATTSPALGITGTVGDEKTRVDWVESTPPALPTAP